MPFFACLSIFFCITLSVYAFLYFCLFYLCLRVFLSPYLTALLSHYLFAFLSFAILSLHLHLSIFPLDFSAWNRVSVILSQACVHSFVHYIKLNYIDDFYPFLSRTASARFAANCIDSSGWISFLRRLSHRSSQNQMGRRQHGRCICRIHVLLCSSA